MAELITTGNKGKGVRSDCSITLEPDTGNGIRLDLKSKVEVMYGRDILEQIRRILDFFSIKEATVTIEDSGALPFVIAARLEAAIHKLIKPEKEWFIPVLPGNQRPTARDRNRRSRLYLPGNTPSLMINAGIHHPDGVILDLEDAVAPDKKEEARFLVKNALRGIDFYGAERMVRINQGERGLTDLEYVIPHQVNMILLPKCEHPEQVVAVHQKIRSIQERFGHRDPVWIMPIIESALGVINAYAIASAVPAVASLAIGLEDYTADLGTQRTTEGTESFMARSMVVNAAKAAGIQPIDSVFSDITDMTGLYENVKRSKSLGFEGMGCIHPRQIQVIHQGFAPSEAEIEKAKRIVLAFDEAEAKGLGVVALGSKMIDPPVVKRALKTIQEAIQTDLLDENWKASYEKV